MSILHPLRTAFPRDNVCYVIWAIWLVAGLASIPEPFFTLHGTEDEFERRNGKLMCRYKRFNVLTFIIAHNLFKLCIGFLESNIIKDDPTLNTTSGITKSNADSNECPVHITVQGEEYTSSNSASHRQKELFCAPSMYLKFHELLIYSYFHH